MVKVQLLRFLLLSVVLLICLAFSVSYFVTAFIEPDTRITAANWAKNTIPSDATIGSEVYDLGITAFNPSFGHITLYNFYDIDNPVSIESIQEARTNKFLILPSQRLVKTRLADRKDFPIGHAFYNQLFTDKLGFKKVYQTPCDIFCQITYLGDPISRFEETASVFDRPTVFIFKKQ